MPGAETHVAQALALWQQVYGGEHDSTLSALNNLAAIQSAQGKLKEAEAKFRQIETIRTKLRGDDDVQLVATLNTLGENLLYQQRADEALAKFEHALHINKKTYQAPHDFIANSEMLTAWAMTNLQRQDQALPLAEDAVVQLRQTHPQGDPRSATADLILAYTQLERGDFPAAQAAAQRAYDFRLEKFGAPDWRSAEAAATLAEARLRQDDATARAVLDTAVATLDKQRPWHPQLARWHKLLAARAA